MGTIAASFRGTIAFFLNFLTLFQDFLILTQELLCSILWAVTKKYGCGMSPWLTGCFCHVCLPELWGIGREKEEKTNVNEWWVTFPVLFLSIKTCSFFPPLSYFFPPPSKEERIYLREIFGLSKGGEQGQFIQKQLECICNGSGPKKFFLCHQWIVAVRKPK